MKHRIVTAAQMKEIERAGDAHGLPYLQMMENAGLAAYAELQKQFPHPGRLLVVCGKGNNGGDGFVIARTAAKDGWSVTVLLAEGEPKTADPSSILSVCTPCRCTSAPTVPYWKPRVLTLLWMLSMAPVPWCTSAFRPCCLRLIRFCTKVRLCAGRRPAQRHQHGYRRGCRRCCPCRSDRNLRQL